MHGHRITTVNKAVRECKYILEKETGERSDAEIKIGALTFSSGARWITENGLVPIEDFCWDDVQAGGCTDLGEALKELESKMSRSEFLVSETGYCLPVIIFMSDGVPTDDWQKALKNATANNKWFKRSRKIAIAISDDADEEVLKELVGNSEAVITADNVRLLAACIRTVRIG